MTRSSAKPLSQRQLRVGEVVRKELSDILIREEILDDALQGSFLMINQVVMSSDLKLATAYVSEINTSNDVLSARIKALNTHSKFLRGHLGRRLTMKFTPDVRFRVDNVADQAEKIDRLLASDKVRRDVSTPQQDSNIISDDS